MGLTLLAQSDSLQYLKDPIRRFTHDAYRFICLNYVPIVGIRPNMTQRTCQECIVRSFLSLLIKKFQLSDVLRQFQIF